MSGPLIPQRGAFVLSGNSVFPFLQPLGPAVRFGGSAEPDAFSFWSEGSFGWDLWRGVSPVARDPFSHGPALCFLSFDTLIARWDHILIKDLLFFTMAATCRLQAGFWGGGRLEWIVKGRSLL